MVPAAPSAGTARRTRGGRGKQSGTAKDREKGKPIQERYECTGWSLSSCSFPFSPFLRYLSRSRPRPFSLTSFFLLSPPSPPPSLFLSLSFSPYVSPLYSFSLSLPPPFSSFWTLSRCACGNFPGVIFAALLARSLTSLSSVYPRRHFSRSPSVPRRSSVGLTPSPPFPIPSFIFPSDFALLVFHGRPRQTSPKRHFFPHARRYVFPSISVFIA